MPHFGHVPGSSLTTSACIGHVQAAGAAAGMSFMPHFGHVPGSSLTTSACIGHVQADAAARSSP